MKTQGCNELDKQPMKWRSFICTHCCQMAGLRSWWWWNNL